MEVSRPNSRIKFKVKRRDISNLAYILLILTSLIFDLIYMQTDFPSLGVGTAGSPTRQKQRKHARIQTITILTKTQSDETNTKYRLVGVVARRREPEQ